MYAGAAYALVWAIGTIAVAASIVRHYQVASRPMTTACPGR